MSMFQFSLEQGLCFLMVILRMSVLFCVMPFFGEKNVPNLVKVGFAGCFSIAVFPLLVSQKNILFRETLIWGRIPSELILTAFLEAAVGLFLGVFSRIAFDALQIGSNFVGNFMGFASASIFDPHQEAQTEVVARLQTTLGMLIFLSMDGHYGLLHVVLKSYQSIGIGRMVLNELLKKKMLTILPDVFCFGLQMAAPVCLSVFCVNLCFGVLSKAMPQLNVFMLSFSVIALLGFCVIFLSFSDFERWVHEMIVYNINVLGEILQIFKGSRTT